MQYNSTFVYIFRKYLVGKKKIIKLMIFGEIISLGNYRLNKFWN